MLILTRKIGETVVIGEEIYCTVLGIKGGQIRLGFDAPTSLSIHRHEIQQKIWKDANDNNRIEDIHAANESIVDRLILQFKNKKG